MRLINTEGTDCDLICSRIIDNVRKESVSNKINHPFNKEWLWEQFKIEFQSDTGLPFEYTENYIKENLSAVFLYFMSDMSFFSCENLYQKEVAPSFDKGLLLVGKVGFGKTNIMKSFESVFKGYKPHHFKIISVDDVVDDYEAIKSQQEKINFYKYYTRGTILFDDLYSEKLANNYGQVNIMKEIIMRRSRKNLKTHFTMNPVEGYEDDPKGNLLALVNFYGARVVDRLFNMCNYINLNGKSKRV
ncbi:hypothetical protein DFQ10_1083 [Winogradskyella eximia]|uniref:Uncharacterized protein n=1 Tax=Winogradskyella eximia TaxID=262006 RepID=A0A3D9GZC4_9FLAO|nr:hypothetical protein [Winogradskyella eximia]RED42597.1 hypothetical protein DFQ10_1083 [Winogradskyella eximia]